MTEPFVHPNLKRNSGDDPTGQKFLRKIKSIDPNEPDNHWSVVRTTVVYANEGWVRFDGSQERMYFGPECDFKVGDRIEIEFRHA